MPLDAANRGGSPRPIPRAVLSANDLRSGRVVWWTGFGWGSEFREAATADDDDARETLARIGRTEEAANTVVGPALVPLGPRGLPAALREARRLAGPSITLPAPLPAPAAPSSEV